MTKTRKKSTIIFEGSDKPLAAKERHYVDNEKFYSALVERKKQLKEAEECGEDPPRISEYIGMCILNIATNLSKKGNFARYPYRDEMIQDAVLTCIRYLDKFNPDITNNPFAYFTQTCTYCFITRIHGEKKQMYVKIKSTLESAALGELVTNEDYSDDNSMVHDNLDVSNDFMESFIEDYEEKNIHTSLKAMAAEYEGDETKTFISEYEEKNFKNKPIGVKKGVEKYMKDD